MLFFCLVGQLKVHLFTYRERLKVVFILPAARYLHSGGRSALHVTLPHV